MRMTRPKQKNTTRMGGGEGSQVLILGSYLCVETKLKLGESLLNILLRVRVRNIWVDGSQSEADDSDVASVGSGLLKKK